MPTRQRGEGKSTREKAREEGKEPPQVKARNVGSIGQTMDNPVLQLREANPDKDYRYVYAPEHRSDYSKLLKRRGQGYTPVDAEKAEIDHIHGEAGNQIRVMDVVLCEIPKEKREGRKAMLAERAAEDARRAQEVFERHVRGTRKEGVAAVPVGSIERTSKEYSVEMEE